MSETQAQAPTAEDTDLFSRDDLKQFAADDVEAGSAIGKMLSFFFLYTIIAMSLVAWWTVSDSAERRSEKANASQVEGGGDH